MIVRAKVETIIGKTYADKLDETLFTIGVNEYSRRQMVEELACANFIAAVRLAKVLRKLGIKTVNQLFKLDPFSLLRTVGIGQSSLFVAMCILDARGYDVMKWWGKKDNVLKFSTYKHNAIRRANKRKQEVA